MFRVEGLQSPLLLRPKFFEGLPVVSNLEIGERHFPYEPVSVYFSKKLFVTPAIFHDVHQNVLFLLLTAEKMVMKKKTHNPASFKTENILRFPPLHFSANNTI
jgi:hypothetical protein